MLSILAGVPPPVVSGGARARGREQTVEQAEVLQSPEQLRPVRAQAAATDLWDFIMRKGDEACLFPQMSGSHYNKSPQN